MSLSRAFDDYERAIRGTYNTTTMYKVTIYFKKGLGLPGSNDVLEIMSNSYGFSQQSDHVYSIVEASGKMTFIPIDNVLMAVSEPIQEDHNF